MLANLYILQLRCSSDIPTAMLMHDDAGVLKFTCSKCQHQQRGVHSTHAQQRLDGLRFMLS